MSAALYVPYVQGDHNFRDDGYDDDARRASLSISWTSAVPPPLLYGVRTRLTAASQPHFDLRLGSKHMYVSFALFRLHPVGNLVSAHTEVRCRHQLISLSSFEVNDRVVS